MNAKQLREFMSDRMRAKSSVILCMNSGSSSLKVALYRMGEKEERLVAQGTVERIGLKGGKLQFRMAEGESLEEVTGDFMEHEVAVHALFDSLEKSGLPRPDAIGHRLVHGGQKLIEPVRVNEQVIDLLQEVAPFAPLHVPREIQTIKAVNARFPGIAQVVCFDTAFHRSIPEIAQRFPLPNHLWDEGIRRYGFHGLSYEYIMSVLDTDASGRVIIAHLGNGASMVAVKNGRPLDTTMGFSPTGGFMMGTRSGDLDPGVLIYLMIEKGYDAQKVEHMVNHEAGLLGVSGISSDMKTLLAKREREPRAHQAIEMFCYHLRKQIGTMAAVLGGIDTLVFTGGIGEKAAPVRWSVCQGLEHFGIHLDSLLNEMHADIISTRESSCLVRVMPTNEDLIIARHTYKVLSSAVSLD